MHPFTPPAYDLKAFHCPHCNAFALQRWHTIQVNDKGLRTVDGLTRAVCSHCEEYTLWIHEKLIYPEVSGIALPNLDLNDAIKEAYLEARTIVNKSPRGAAALLRLCIQMLCVQLGEKGKTINDDIASLVKNGLPSRIQKALDIVRVVGNNAVHPGQMDIKDDREIAITLFQVINLIAEVMITQPREIDDLYRSLPQKDLDNIQKRDNTA